MKGNTARSSTLGSAWAGEPRGDVCTSSLLSQPLLLFQDLTLSQYRYVSFQYIGAGEMLSGCRKCSEEKSERGGDIFEATSFLLPP